MSTAVVTGILVTSLAYTLASNKIQYDTQVYTNRLAQLSYKINTQLPPTSNRKKNTTKDDDKNNRYKHDSTPSLVDTVKIKNNWNGAISSIAEKLCGKF